MLDLNYLRNNLNEVAEKLKIRGFKLDTKTISDLEDQRKQIQVKTQELQNQRNQLSKQIGIAKRNNEDTAQLMQQVNQINEQLHEYEVSLEALQEQLRNIYYVIPNIPHSSVPAGTSEADNVEIKKWGAPKNFAFTPKDHTELGDNLGMLDFDLAAKLTGARFVVMRKDLVKLHRALIRFMIDVHTQQHGYEEIYVPYIVNSDSLYGTGQLPKFADDQFKLVGEQNYFLIPTAEVPVTNTVRDVILEENKLPLKYVCHTPCFRSEAGSYGKDTKGMIRQHQFEKVELVWITHPDQSYKAHEELTAHAEKILQLLNLPYRVMVLCGADLGFGAAKTYDLEVWLPSQQTYREISSCSNTESFQARRMQARFRNSQTNKPELVHTLNGSGLAVGRTLIAIMENYQDQQGNIHIPEVLIPYMNGTTIIGVDKDA